MKVKKILAAALICGIGSCIFSGCGIRQPKTAEQVYAGVTCYNKSDAFLSELNTCIKEHFKGYSTEQLPVTVTIRDAGGSQRVQNDQVRELIGMGCNVLCVNLVDRADPSEIIDLAMEHQIPIIFYNREPVAEDLMQWDSLYYVGADAKESGVMQGELAADVLLRSLPQADRNKDGKIQYVVLEGEAGHQDSIIRTENAVNTLQNNGIELEKLSCQIANWSHAQAQNRMEQMIVQYQGRIELVLANNDDMALGALDAYEKFNFTESTLPIFFGIDGTDAGLNAVKESKLAGTVYNDKEGQADAIAKLAVALVSGKGMSEIELRDGKYIYLPYSKVTDENVDDFIDVSH